LYLANDGTLAGLSVTDPVVKQQPVHTIDPAAHAAALSALGGGFPNGVEENGASTIINGAVSRTPSDDTVSNNFIEGSVDENEGEDGYQQPLQRINSAFQQPSTAPQSGGITKSHSMAQFYYRRGSENSLASRANQQQQQQSGMTSPPPQEEPKKLSPTQWG